MDLGHCGVCVLGMGSGLRFSDGLQREYGPSAVTVSVYIYSSLLFQLGGVELVDRDMWEVLTILWPSGDVTLVTDQDVSHKITPEYNHPIFTVPE